MNDPATPARPTRIRTLRAQVVGAFAITGLIAVLISPVAWIHHLAWLVVVFGAIVEIASGKGLGDTDVSTALTAIPGVAIGLAVVYAIGIRTEQAAD